jgi:hypothetical protein
MLNLKFLIINFAFKWNHIKIAMKEALSQSVLMNLMRIIKNNSKNIEKKIINITSI